MTKQNHARIAIFQADWPLQSQTANCSIMLAEAGYDVELYLSNAWKTWTLVEGESITRGTKVQIHDLTPTRSLYKSISSRLRKFRRCYLHRQLEEQLIDPSIVPQALQYMTGNHYRCLIGVEKKGLIWAGKVAEKLEVPFVYYNLELYTDDYHRSVMGDSSQFSKLRAAECKYHRRSSATIIQDPDRARVLFQDNGVAMSKANVLYVPVSVMGGPYKNRSSFLHDVLGISKRQKIILYFGLIWEKRYAFELAEAAQNLPEDWVLVMHGYAEDPSTLEKIKALDRYNRVIISLKMVPSNRIQEIVASADIGLVLYSPLPQNDRLTAFASEKMALYMQCGVPFVAFDYPGYLRLANEERCGVVIRSLDDLPDATREILLSYDVFRRRAYQTFYKYYDYSRNFEKVTESLGYLRPASQLGSEARTGVDLTE